MANRRSLSIGRFLPLNKTSNKMNFYPGRLMRNENYLYNESGGLEERYGGSDLSNGPTSAKAYGFTNYINNEGSQFLLMAQGTKIYYYNSGWVDSGVTVTNNLTTRFEQAGFGSNRNMYCVNGTDSVIKITTTVSVPAGSLVSSSPTDGNFIKLHKNRLFVANNRDTVYFTDVNAFETWAMGTNDFQVAPGVDGYIQGLEIWGDSLFIFKETGIYILPNAADSASNWKILKIDAETGTQSPDTIRRTKNGIYFLATDGRIRKINPNVTFTSGEYVLGGTGSPVISEMIQDDISTYIERSNISNAHAVLFNDLYIIWYNSTNATGNENDMCFAADTTKFENVPAIPAPQPYWTQFTNFAFDYAVMQTLSNDPVLYCVDEDSKTVSRLVNGISNDSGSAIESIIEVGWTAPIGFDGNIDTSTYRRFHPILVYADLENWNLDVFVSTYKIGNFLPDEINDREYSVSGDISAAVVGTAVVGTDLVGNIGIKSDKFRTGLRGNLIAIKCQNLNADEFTRINRIEIFYENLHRE